MRFDFGARQRWRELLLQDCAAAGWRLTRFCISFTRAIIRLTRNVECSTASWTLALPMASRPTTYFVQQSPPDGLSEIALAAARGDLLRVNGELDRFWRRPSKKDVNVSALACPQESEVGDGLTPLFGCRRHCSWRRRMAIWPWSSGS